MEAITAGNGTTHVSSADDRELYAGIVGAGCYVCKTGDQLKCTMQTANKAVIGTGAGFMYGTGFRNSSAEEVTIKSGAQAQRRNDLVCVHFTTDSAGNETAELAVLEGKSTSAATATDPAIPAGDLLEGATEAWMPLWRIPLDGITVGKPVALFDILAPAADVWDSVSPTILYENASNTLKGPITLSEAPTNFARVTYFCKTDDGDRFSVEVPGSSPTFLASCCRWQGSTPAVFVKSRAYSVSGRTVDTYADVAGGATHYQSGMAAINTSTNTVSGGAGDYITIIKAIGWRI